MYKKVDVLAVAAHPDDAELGCGGTLLKLRQKGLRVGIVDLTHGELGSRGSSKIRHTEATTASRILGLEFRSNLELEDGNISVDKESRLKLVRVVRECRPRLVISHSTAGHPDHGRTATLVDQAVHTSGLLRVETGQERFRPEKIAYWIVFNQTDIPHVVVDVSDVYDQKEQAVKAYASQLYNPGAVEPETYISRAHFLDQVRSFHVHMGSLAGCYLGEGFLLSRLPVVHNLVEC